MEGSSKGWQGALGAVLKALGAAFAERFEEQLRAAAARELTQDPMDARKAAATRFREAWAERPFAFDRDTTAALERELAEALLSGRPEAFLTRLRAAQDDGGWALLQRLAFYQRVAPQEGMSLQLGDGRVDVRAAPPVPAPRPRPKLELIRGGADEGGAERSPEA